MINFLLKYTGTYGLLAILAVAIVTPTYFFFTSQQELRQELSAEKQDVSNEEKIADKTVLTEEIKESIIYYALNNLLNNLKDSDINNLIEYTPLQSLSAEEIIDLIEMTMADQ